VENLYKSLAEVKGSVGEKPLVLGRAGQCRFCSTTDPAAFKNRAHTMPESLGNKWITSADECDDCNRLFARYDDALAKSVAPILTVGGTKGKNNKVRQTGRTAGPAVIRHDAAAGRRRISMEVRNMPIEQCVGLDLLTGTIRFRVPVASERFVPLHAYKAIAKIGFALLPEAELQHFTRLREWLRSEGNPDDLVGLVVGVSFGSIGNAPPLASGFLLRRRVEDNRLPYMVFVTSVGSVCMQIDLKSDEKDGTWPAGERGRIALRYANVIAPPNEPELRINYGDPVHLDWSENGLVEPMLEAIDTTVNIRTSEGQMAPIFRASQIAQRQ